MRTHLRALALCAVAIVTPGASASFNAPFGPSWGVRSNVYPGLCDSGSQPSTLR